LSARHEICAIVAGYPGAHERVEDGVRWIPVGLRTGTRADQLSYFGYVAPSVRRYPHDVLVEDFSAPFSVGFSPLFTRQPVIASVQWLFASEMSRKYHLPFAAVERFGLRFYDRFIGVSGWVVERLRQARPAARIEMIPEGVEEFPFTLPPTEPRHLLFVGRLDNQQKGLDLLLSSYARVAQRLSTDVPPLIVIGDGPDASTALGLAARLGVNRLVEFRGRIEGPEKYRLMASAHAVLVPSRYETFGMVAVEALAAGVPVAGFDIGPLREVAAPGGARLVPQFDVEALATEVVTVVRKPAYRVQLGAQGRRWAKQFGWNEIASRQEAFYEQAAAAGR
jgi:glycogen(starch) synthase